MEEAIKNVYIFLAPLLALQSHFEISQAFGTEMQVYENRQKESGEHCDTFALAFRKMSSVIAKAGPSKEATPVLETPEKEWTQGEVRGDDGGDLCWEERLELKRSAKFALN